MNTTAAHRPLRRIGAVVVAALLAALPFARPSHAQDDIATELQCLRYVQAYERNFQIPAGLLTSIAFVESGRPGTDGKMTAWPWTINVNGQGSYFNTKEEAVAAVRKLMDEGQRSIDIGCMQINLRYHPSAFNSIDEAFDPATNVAYGAKFLKSLHELQGSWPNAVERFHSSNDARRAQYREKVMAFWNDEARSMIMDAVMAENTDTPYHRALRDYAQGRYAEALEKYQNIVETAPKDRIGLLGLAMSYEKLGRGQEAHQSYVRYLAIEPTNESVASRIVDAALRKSPDVARRELEDYVTAGVRRHDFLSAVSQVAVAQGDDAAAISYAVAAATAAPNVAVYHLNAAVLSDRLKHKADAVTYYAQFLDLFERNPVMVDTSITSIRERAKYLAAQL